MPDKKARKNCPMCGAHASMAFEARDTPVTYKGHTSEHRTTTWWCSKCDDGILEPEMLEARERVFIALRAEVEDVLLPEQVAAIRARLGISQREAGRILGGGTRAFQKYESGETPVSEPMKNLLVLLGNDPKRLRELPGIDLKRLQELVDATIAKPPRENSARREVLSKKHADRIKRERTQLTGTRAVGSGLSAPTQSSPLRSAAKRGNGASETAARASRRSERLSMK